MPDRLLTVGAVAKRLGVSTRQVRRFLSDPTDPLPHVRLGRRCRRIAPAELDVWLRRRRETAVRQEPGLFAGFSDDARSALEQLCSAPTMHPQRRKGADAKR